MSNRLNKERQGILEPIRMQYAIEKLTKLGYEVHKASDSQIWFYDRIGVKIYFFPYSGWFSGKTVTAGRGIENLLSQIGNINDF